MNSIKRFYNYRLRGTDQQIGDEVIALGAAQNRGPYATQDPQTLGYAPSAVPDSLRNYTPRGALSIHGYSLQNRSGTADLAVGLGFRLRNDQWVAGQWDDSEGAASHVNDTYDAQDRGTDDFALESLTANDGFTIASAIPFNWISVDVTTAGVGAGTVATVRYSNLAGTGWTTLGTNQTWIAGTGADNFTRAAAANLATGENIFVWDPPLNWGKVSVIDATMGGIPIGMYAWQVRCTTAPTTAALARAIEIGTLIAIENLDDDAILSDENCFHWEPQGDAIVAYFSTLNIGNNVKVQWKHSG